MDVCFGDAIKADVQERCDRFIEEALEFVQAAGYSPERAHALVDYTFGRPLGEINQEVGGVVVTLAAMCNTLGVDFGAAAETELARIWTKVEQIRAKQAAKPTGSALPVARASS
jgi:NTP pyrophosphatase (non-canonical NTP hydrolase)